MCGRCARSCRALFPGATFSFLPADIVTQILNFGSPAPIDVQIVGTISTANSTFANKLLRGSAVFRARRRAHPAGVQAADAERRLRPLAGEPGRPERESAATSMLDTLAGSTQTNRSTGSIPTTRFPIRSRSQTPQYRDGQARRSRYLPLTRRIHRSCSAASRRSTRAEPRRRVALQHPAGRSTSMRRRRAATSARSPRTSKKSCDDMRA